MIENNKAARISYLSRLTTIVLLVAVLLLAFTAGKNVAAEESDGGDDNDVIKVSLHRLDYLFEGKEGVFFIRLELDDPERTFEEIQLAGQLTLTSDDMPVVGQTFSYYSVSSMDWIDVQTDADGKVWLPSIDDSSIVLRYEEFLEDGYLDFQVFTQLSAGEYNIVAELFDVTEEPVKLSSWESTFSVGQSPLQIIGIENFNNLYGGLKQEVPITLKLDGDTELVNHKNDLYYVLALYGDYVGVASLDLLEEDDLIEIWNDNTDSWEELEVFDDIGAVIPADWDALASDDGETLKLRVRLSIGEYHVELYLAEMPDLDDPNTWVLVDYSHDDITVSPPFINFAFDRFDKIVADLESNVEITVSIDNDDVTLDGSYRYFLHLTTSDGTPIAGQEILYPEGSEDNWQALLTDEHGNAYFGPHEGFTLDDEPALTSDEGVTTPFKVTMPSGIYRLHVGLVDVTNGQEVIGGLASISFDVLPVVEYSFQNFDDLRSNREGDVSVTVIVHHPEIIGEEKFLRYRAELLRDDSPVSNLDIQYFDLASDDWNTFTTNNEGVAYFGPASGFTLAQLPDLTGGGVTTTFRAKLPRGGYELSLRIVDVSDPNNPVDITNVPAGTVTFRVQQNNSSRVEDVLPDTTPSPEQQSPRTPAPSSDTQPVSSDTTTIAKAGIEAFDLAVTVPAGALEGSGSLSVEAVDEGDQPEPGAGRFMIGNQVFEIVVEDEEGNNVRQFNRPLTLSFEYDPSALPDDVSEEDLYVYYWHEQLGNWVLLPTERDAATGQITATVNHLTTFTLMAVPNLQIPYDLKGHWSENDVLKLIDLDIVSGYADGSIQPNRTVTRAEFTKMLVGAMGLQPLTMPRLEFADAHVVPAWSHGYVAAAVRAGIITGFADNSFRADTPITREQLATMVIRALESLEQNGNGSADNESSLVFSDAVHISEWARDAVAAATELGIVTGMADGTFRPAQTATRAEAATMLSRLIEVTASR